MVNAWSLLDSEINGTMDEDYPIMYGPDDEIEFAKRKKEKEVDDVYAHHYPHPQSTEIGLGEEIYEELLDPEEYAKYKDEKPWDPELIKARIEANSPYNDGWTKEYYQDIVDKKMGKGKVSGNRMLNTEVQQEKESMTAHYFKYHEDEIIKDVESYVSGTYRGHYTGTTHEYRNVQTLDLMAARDVASGFCQANILKYGSRYGSKDGKNKKDLMKVIHYAMLLLHFDDHYGKPSQTTGNIDHNMP